MQDRTYSENPEHRSKNSNQMPSSKPYYTCTKKIHWLPVKYRVRFKILLLTYKYNNNLTPGYLSCLVTPYQQERSLRSQSQGLLQVPKSRLKSYGDRSFKFAAATEWNKLPVDIRFAPSINVLRLDLRATF